MPTTTNPHPDTGELLTFAQAAQALGVGILDVRRMVRTEQLGYVLDDRGRRRIPAASLAGRLA